MAPQYTIAALDPSRHRRDDFKCESPDLVAFLQKRARREMDARASACFVLAPKTDPGRIAGFYTLSAAEIVMTDLPEHLRRKMPRYRNLPATLLGRLARDLDFRGQGIGDLLMQDALGRALAGSGEVGSIGVVTDPKDEAANTFYRSFGFLPLTTNRLFLPMTAIAELQQR